LRASALAFETRESGSETLPNVIACAGRPAGGDDLAVLDQAVFLLGRVRARLIAGRSSCTSP
jgi:hypothetical protein